jgi:hypothetical protein
MGPPEKEAGDHRDLRRGALGTTRKAEISAVKLGVEGETVRWLLQQSEKLVPTITTLVDGCSGSPPSPCPLLLPPPISTITEEASTASCSRGSGSMVPITTAALSMTRLLELDEGVLAEPLASGVIAICGASSSYTVLATKPRARLGFRGRA